MYGRELLLLNSHAEHVYNRIRVHPAPNVPPLGSSHARSPLPARPSNYGYQVPQPPVPPPQAQRYPRSAPAPVQQAIPSRPSQYNAQSSSQFMILRPEQRSGQLRVAAASNISMRDADKALSKDDDVPDPNNRFACDQPNCGKRYATMGNLNRHRKTAHGIPIR
ncbi:hypothetical protein EXIGLDRAFT_312033 [Exidia glandulosa HHB12029]|uniref:C2H2-type domain-containing protein n=1 Tax=Exidia glandulosa HHB12029 TaxID=1314781 RepID=A0A165ZK97_EXIGL|nr:hypothetical protein EXIGLDRAFT_312033 [Exidia glandulosa HHB12029]